MFNGKGKVWREGDKLHAVINLNTPSGPIEWKDEVTADLDDPTAHDRLMAKARYVAGFFPTKEMVGSDAYSTAERLYDGATKPETREEALIEIRSLKSAAMAGDDDACDVGYALDRIVASRAEVVGARVLKKLGKRLKKVGKVAAGVAFPPYGAYQLAKAAKKNIAARKKVVAIARMARTPPKQLAAAMNAPLAAAEEMQAKAAEAAQYIDQADEIQEAAYEETGDYDAFAPASYDEGYSGGSGQAYDSEEEEFIGLALYRDGADYGEEVSGEEIAGLWDVAKAIGKKIDPTRPNSPYRAGLAAIPGIGPAIKASLDVIDAAKKGQKEAAAKIKAIRELASAGVPKAKEAEANLKTAQELAKKMEREVARELNPPKKTWFPGFSIYSDGARS